MSKTTDWVSPSRTGQLTMANKWRVVAGANAAAWGIPGVVLQDLDTLTKTAETALAAAQSEETRTPVATAQCREAFEALVSKMRDIKRRYFLSPPLKDADYIALGLKPHDATPTPSGIPSAQATVETFLIGRHELGIKIVYLTGNPGDPANKGYRIWYKLAAPGEMPPKDPKELGSEFFTRRKKDKIKFDFGDSGKMAYFAVQIENDQKKGPWGSLVSALIP